MQETALLLEILKDQVTPALGCTEPVAVAYATAKAKEVAGGEIQAVEIKVDRNIFKNAMGVYIPGTDQKGLEMAVALAVQAGRADYELEVLKAVAAEDVIAANAMIEAGKIHISIAKERRGIYIEALVRSRTDEAKVVIKDKHNQIVRIEKNGQMIFTSESQMEKKVSLRDHIKGFRIADLKAFADQADLKQLEFVAKGIEMNKRIATEGLKNKSGMALGHMLSQGQGSVSEYAKIMTASACDARMSGYSLPVMSCAGSGNHGLVAFLPVVSVGEKSGKTFEQILRAVTLSLLVTIYVKSYTGTLSPVCGCGVAAGVGASAAIAYLLGGDLAQIDGAIKNMIGGLSGIICDGAKPGCAFKLSISAGSAIEAAEMALNNIYISFYDGIVDTTAEKTIQNMGKVATMGMVDTDETILEVMLMKCS